MLQIIIIEIKCGMYVMVCTILLNDLFLTSFMRMASIIGAGKLNTSSLADGKRI